MIRVSGMDRFDPSKWSSSFVKKHENVCLDLLERFSGAMNGALSESEYLAAAQCCSKLCDGLIKMAETISADRYEPMFYSYSFILAQIIMFGIGSEQCVMAAIKPLNDAYNYACSCAENGRRTSEKARVDAELIGNVIRDINNKRSVLEIKNTYCPDFPYNIIKD